MLTPLSPSAWTPFRAMHLLARAGFGAPPKEAADFHALGLRKAVEKMLAGEEDDDLFPPPALTQPPEIAERARRARGAATEEEKRAIQQQHRISDRGEIRDLRTWWLNRMRHGSHPLREKMTLFWHGHFASSAEKVRAPYLLWKQNETLRARALGDFCKLTADISRDPAMMRYLDTNSSTREHPNENFARELLELFTLGESVRYTEKDIREAARAFTGYRIDLRNQTFRFARRLHDGADKAFLGQAGPFSGDGIIAIILQQPECGEFISRKIWRFFAEENPSPALVQALARGFRNSGYDLSALLRTIFLSEEFYSPRAVGTQIKSPVQWVVQTARVLEAPLPAPEALEGALSQMGQVLFAPPNVKGWDGGRAWITSATLLFRYNLAGYIVSGRAPALDGLRKSAGPVRIPLDRIAPVELRSDPAALCDCVALRLLGAPLSGHERQRFLVFLGEHGPAVDEPALRDFLRLMMSTPEYQLT